jgi:uncharacterized protein YbjT (DUF2867 family)
MIKSRNTAGDSTKSVFVAGASGYIGGRLVPRLLERGYRVRCLARSPKKLGDRGWASEPRIEIVAGDLADTDRLAEQMRGCGAAYYLAHSMLAQDSASTVRDRELAGSFSAAAARTECKRVLYLGGLAEACKGARARLASRLEVETALRSGPTPVTVLRAGTIIGSGSASFEILRYLVERQPVMVAPRWVDRACQPISVRNVLDYLVAVMELPKAANGSLDIGGSEVLPYREVICHMAAALGLRRRPVLPIPMVTARMGSLWIHLVTPVSHRIAMPLADGLQIGAVCKDSRAEQLMPQRLLGVRESIDAALGKVAEGRVETSWSDAGLIAGDPDWAGGTTFVHREETEVEATAEEVFRSVCRIGGRHGWYAMDFLWRLRGLMDQLVGGPGLDRGRRSADQIRHGDALDFWRVTGVERNRSLVLRAEMKVPGEAVLEFRIKPMENLPGLIWLEQIARFKPKGLGGILYWYFVLPFHGIIFRGMLSGIRHAAEKQAAAAPAEHRKSSEGDVPLEPPVGGA